MAENKVQFGLDKLYYAVITEGTGGAITFGTPKPIPGAVSLSMDAEGEETVFYADNVRYFVSQDNNGYTGDIEIAKVPEDMWEDVFGVTVDTNSVMIENSDAEIKEVALLFRFSGDKNKNCCALYRCTLSRPTISHQTTEGSKEPQTSTISYTAIPLPDGKVRATTLSTTADSVKEGWFSTVYQTATT